ncbi:uncharacterized protein A4U43_C05F11610 [Asparagus officinalis]|uniref:Uncharacterized protein n=1 Tax=Asparagus officinalis TaxID=4686 RepID=A0A5P1ER78_ASPOF|nr:uncharacterized protein A4U43_C05F11610 [Asparagus officinalis]
MGSSSSSSSSPTDKAPASAPAMHQSDADEDDDNVKQLSECSVLYLTLQALFNPSLSKVNKRGIESCAAAVVSAESAAVLGSVTKAEVAATVDLTIGASPVATTNSTSPVGTQVLGLSIVAVAPTVSTLPAATVIEGDKGWWPALGFPDGLEEMSLDLKKAMKCRVIIAVLRRKAEDLMLERRSRGLQDKMSAKEIQVRFQVWLV